MRRAWIFMIGGLLAGCVHFQPKPLSAERTASDFQSRSLTNSGLRAFLETNHVAGTWPRPSWDLKALTLAAFYYHPDLAVARADLAIADAARIQAGERPNPSVGFSPTYDTTTLPPWILTLTWDIPIETAGKRRYRLEAARHLSDAARWNFVAAAWQVRSRLRARLLDLYGARRTSLLLARQESAQSNVVNLLVGQLKAGNVSSFDVTQARIALDNARLSLQDARRQQVDARSILAGALGLPLAALDGVRFSYAEFESFPTRLTEPKVRRQAVLGRADVRRALAEYAASQSDLQLQIARQYPNLHLGPGYELDQTDNKWSLGATVTLPILNQNQGAIAVARANRQKAAAHFRMVQASAIGQIDRALAGYQAALQQSATAAALLKNLRARLNSVQAMEGAGEVAPLAVAQARVEYSTGALARLKALVQAQQSLGNLEDAVQSPLTLPGTLLEQELKDVKPLAQNEP